MKVIKFGADWCESCKTLTKLLDELNTKVPIESFDIEKDFEYASMCGVRSVPTLIMVDGPIEVKRFSGTKSKTELHDWLGGI